MDEVSFDSLPFLVSGYMRKIMAVAMWRITVYLVKFSDSERSIILQYKQKAVQKEHELDCRRRERLEQLRSLVQQRLTNAEVVFPFSKFCIISSATLACSAFRRGSSCDAAPEHYQLARRTHMTRVESSRHVSVDGRQVAKKSHCNATHPLDSLTSLQVPFHHMSP